MVHWSSVSKPVVLHPHISGFLSHHSIPETFQRRNEQGTSMSAIHSYTWIAAVHSNWHAGNGCILHKEGGNSWTRVCALCWIDVIFWTPMLCYLCISNPRNIIPKGSIWHLLICFQFSLEPGRIKLCHPENFNHNGCFFDKIFVSSRRHPENPEETRVIVGSIYEHGICIRHCRESYYSQPVPSQVRADPTRPQWRTNGLMSLTPYQRVWGKNEDFIKAKISQICYKNI